MNKEDLINFCLIPDIKGLFNYRHHGGYPGITYTILNDLRITINDFPKSAIEISIIQREKIVNFINNFINNGIGDKCELNQTFYSIYENKVYTFTAHILFPYEFRIGEFIDTFIGDDEAVRLLLKAALCRVLGHRIDNILFIFPTLGQIVEMDITGWDHVPLVSYLYSNFSEFPQFPKVPNFHADELPDEQLGEQLAEQLDEQLEIEEININENVDVPDYLDCIGLTISNSGSIYSSISEFNSKYLQIFISGNNNTNVKITELDYRNTKEHLEVMNKKLFIHAPYTINLSNITDDNFVVSALQRQLNAGIKLGASGVVIHVGKPGTTYTDVQGLENMRKNVINTAKYATQSCKLLIETPAGQGTELLTDINDMYSFWFNLPNEFKNVVGICVDTCHVFACGYDPDKYIQDILSRGCPIDLIHFNDSKNPKNSHVDRHACPGKGYIGSDLIKTLKIIKDHNIPAVLES